MGVDDAMLAPAAVEAEEPSKALATAALDEPPVRFSKACVPCPRCFAAAQR